jgi:hypothetical protein
MRSRPNTRATEQRANNLDLPCHDIAVLGQTEVGARARERARNGVFADLKRCRKASAALWAELWPYHVVWRREEESNLRDGFPSTGPKLASALPLSHPSAVVASKNQLVSKSNRSFTKG